MKRLLLIGVFIVGAAGCGGVKEEKDSGKKTDFTSSQFPSEAKTIFGGWEASSIKDRLDFRVFFNRKGQYAVEMICDTGTGDIRASGMGNAKVEASTITLQTGVSGKGVNDKGQESCNFMWGPYSSVYSISNEVLTMSIPDGAPRTFHRMW